MSLSPHAVTVFSPVCWACSHVAHWLTGIRRSVKSSAQQGELFHRVLDSSTMCPCPVQWNDSIVNDFIYLNTRVKQRAYQWFSVSSFWPKNGLRKFSESIRLYLFLRGSTDSKYFICTKSHNLKYNHFKRHLSFLWSHSYQQLWLLSHSLMRFTKHNY